MLSVELPVTFARVGWGSVVRFILGAIRGLSTLSALW